MKKRVSDPSEDLDPIEVRNKIVDSLIQSSFQLSATGTIFTMGQESSPSWQDVVFVLNRLYTTGYVVQYNLLPFTVEPEILVSGLAKEVVAWLVPTIIQSVDRKVLAGQIDILSPNNRSLVFLCDVLGWYWYKTLHGPKPVVQSLVKMQKNPAKVVQNVALVCPMCYHQCNPPERYKTQSSKAWYYARWFPTHLVEYHKWAKPGTKKGGTK